MYQDFLGFKEKPFENTPDPRFMYYSSKHEEALMRLLYTVKEKKGAAMLTGEYGSGKTLLSRVAMAELLKQNERYAVALIVNPAISKEEFLSEIIYQFGGRVEKEDKTSDSLRKLNDILYKNAENKKHSVIIIDETQAIEDVSTFEELRLLLNFQFNEAFLLTLLLVGQPELRDKLNKIPQFKQRLAIKYHLGALDANETGEYIKHRCRIAGREDPVFSDSAISLIYRASKGIPREINNICDLCLVIAFGKKNASVEEDVASQVIGDLEESLDDNLTQEKANG